MRVLFFSPVGQPSLLSAAFLQQSLSKFSPCTVVDAQAHYGIESFDDFMDQSRRFIHAFDAVLVCAPKTDPAAKAQLLNNIRTYTAQKGARSVIALSSDNDLQAAYNLLRAGAVHVYKPGDHMGELAVHLERAKLRNIQFKDALPPYVMGPFTLDFAAKKATVAGAEVDLTGSEYAVVEFLCARKGRTFDREKLLEAISLNKDSANPYTLVNTFVGKARAKISDANTAWPDLGMRIIRSQAGRGYYAVESKADFDALIKYRQKTARTAEAQPHGAAASQTPVIRLLP